MKRKGRIRLWAVIFWLAVWQIASMVLRQELFLVSPARVLLRLSQLALEPPFWASIASSLLRIGGGFLLAAALGAALAVLAAGFSRVRELLEPLMLSVKSVPVASFIILALLLFSSRYLAILISFLIVLPVVYTNVCTGIQEMDKSLLEMARVYRFSRKALFRAVYLPALLPPFLSAARVGLGFAWKAGIAGEVIAIASGSMGYRLYTAKTTLATVDLFAWTGFIILLSCLLERGMVALMDLGTARLAPEPGKEGGR